MQRVRLSREEGLAAAVKAAYQMMDTIEGGWIGRDHGGKSGRSMRERWAQGIHGQMCEEAFCKWISLFPTTSIKGIKDGDPGGYAIRGTPWSDGHLIINGAEVPKYMNTPFVLVTGHWPEFQIVGWIMGAEAAQEKYWRADERPPSWWVPQSVLHPISELPNARRPAGKDSPGVAGAMHTGRGLPGR